VARSCNDHSRLGSTVQDEIGYAIYPAQVGEIHPSAKPLKGLGSGVLEVVSAHQGDTFRAVYTVRVQDRVYVLHACQKTSKKGTATPQPDMALVPRRLARAAAM
jgi:phage-related protein